MPELNNIGWYYIRKMQHDEPKRHLGSEMGRILLYFHPGGGYSTISLRSSMTHFVNYCNPRIDYDEFFGRGTEGRRHPRGKKSQFQKGHSS